MIPRADPAPFTPAEVAALLRAAPAVLRAELAAPPHLLGWHPTTGAWCVKEVLGHLIEAEKRGFAGRIRVMLAEAEPQLVAWDQLEVARARRDCVHAAAALLSEFEALRSVSVGLVEGLGPADLLRGGHHPKVGYLRIGDLLHEWVHHDRNHIRQIMANVQAFAWPGMGNAQRFSEP